MIVCKSDESDDDVAVRVMEAIIPCMKKKREKLMEQLQSKMYSDSMEGTQTTSVSQKAANTSSVQPAVVQTEEPSMILVLDGEYAQLHHILDELAPSEPTIQFFKLCAASSHYQQPNDVSRGFHFIKNNVNDWNWRSKKVATPGWYKSLNNELKARNVFSGPSELTVLGFMRCLPSIIHDSCTSAVVMAGWRMTGLVPYVPQVMLGNWPFFPHLTLVEKDGILAAATRLFPEVLEHGCALEESLTSALTQVLKDSLEIEYVPGIVPTLHPAVYGESSSSSSAPPVPLVVEQSSKSGRKKRTHKKPLEDRPLNQQRCLWLNHASVLARHKAKQEAKRLAEQQKKTPRKRKGAVEAVVPKKKSKGKKTAEDQF